MEFEVEFTEFNLSKKKGGRFYLSKDNGLIFTINVNEIDLKDKKSIIRYAGSWLGNKIESSGKLNELHYYAGENTTDMIFVIIDESEEISFDYNIKEGDNRPIMCLDGGDMLIEVTDMLVIATVYGNKFYKKDTLFEYTRELRNIRSIVTIY